MQGRRLSDSPIGTFPVPREDLQPGDYWRVQRRDDSGEPLDVLGRPEDRRWWGDGEDDPRFAGNLTGSVWGFIDPNGSYGMLSIHTVREHDDGTISVRPGDGSSNSILCTGGPADARVTWHGYIDHGVWEPC